MGLKNDWRELQAEVGKLAECGEDAVVIVDDPARLPPELRMPKGAWPAQPQLRTLHVLASLSYSPL